VQNDCQHPIRLALAYHDDNKSGDFSMAKWWSFDVNEGFYLATNGNRILANSEDYENTEVFYYAEATDNSGKIMKGTYQVTFGDISLPTRYQKLSRNVGDAFVLRIPYTCD
jgi:hypothetical protein